jgi:hypothetical protein
MRRIATISALAALMTGAAALEASAGDGCCRRGAYFYGPPAYVVPANPWAAWRAYYGAQAEVSAARRAGRANYFAATGRAIPSRVFGPPTNYYAERYAREPYSYFTCGLARRGEGICPGQAPLSAVSDWGP